MGLLSNWRSKGASPRLLRPIAVLAVLAVLGGVLAGALLVDRPSERPGGTVTGRSAPPGQLPWLETVGRRIVVADTDRTALLRGANVLRSEWDLSMDAERRAVPALAQEWGGNVLVRGFASDPVNAGDEDYLALLDEHVSLAAEHGMYVVFAWRSYEINGEQPPMPDDRAQDALVALAKRYHGVSHVMYALQVEPHDVSWSQVQPRFADMVQAIHAAAAPHVPIVMVPGVDYGRDLSGAIDNPVPGENVVYKSHQYNGQEDFQRYFLDAHEAGLPVFLGEFGIADEAGMRLEDVQGLLDVAREEGLGWAAWNMDYQGGPALVTDNFEFEPTEPFGRVVQEEMRSTPQIRQS